MCTYGKAYGFRIGLYLAINKNNDDIHVEIVALDWSLGDDMYRRAEDIITARIPPTRISDNPQYHVCTTCHLRDECHYGKPPVKNCRSCINAYPTEDGEWYCAGYQANIPREFVPIGCNMWARLA
jgi:hypothetical protein